MNYIETRLNKNDSFSKRFRYWQAKHDDIAFCKRTTKLWWRPVMWLGNTGAFRYWNEDVTRWVRKYMTYD